MRTVAVLPIKSFDAAKQRLSSMLGTGSRHLLAQAMFADVLAALRRTRRLDAVAVVTDDHEAEAVLRGERVTVLEDERREGQSAAALIGVHHALAEGFRRVLLVPGDTPLILPAEIDRLLETSQADRLGVAIVPDRRHAGTNALVISPPDALRPSFGPGSLARHLEAARQSGLRHRVEEVASLMHDVDTPEDLADLAVRLERCHGVAPRTRGALRQLDRLHLGAAAREPWAPAAERGPAGAGGSAGERRPAPGAGAAPGGEGASPDQSPAWA